MFDFLNNIDLISAIIGELRNINLYDKKVKKKIKETKKIWRD